MVQLNDSGPKPLTKQQEFLYHYSPAAVEVQRQYGIPASVALAQAALESSWGESSLARFFHNLFGIKGKGDAGTAYLPTQEYVDGSYQTQLAGFAQYSSAEVSFADYGDLLKRNKRYAEAFNAPTAEAAVDAIAAAGYATDPEYADKVKSIIRDYNLTMFDSAAASSDGGESQGFWADLWARIQRESRIYEKSTEKVEEIKEAIDVKGIVGTSVKTIAVLVLVVLLVLVVVLAIPNPAAQAAKALTNGG